MTVTLHESTTAQAAAVVVADASKDLAVLELPGARDLPTVSFGDSNQVPVGTAVIAIGFALGLAGEPTVTDGIVSAIRRQVSTESANGAPVTLTGMLQTDAPISSGNSGGPLVDASAQVIGINTIVATSSSSTSAQNIGFAIGAQSVQAELRTAGSS